MQGLKGLSLVSLLFSLSFLLIAAAATATAQTYTVLHYFEGAPDGQRPRAVLYRDAAGNLYGTTSSGGTGQFAGVIFRLDSSGNETILHYFNVPFGAYPWGGLVADAEHNAYGTTQNGGSTACSPDSCGVVYKLAKSRQYTFLHYFTGVDGAYPVGTLVRDPQGNLYGTTTWGGAHDGGVIFEIDASGNFQVLHDLDGSHDGYTPYGSLIRGKLGYLYGTTYSGGGKWMGSGTVFKFDPTSGKCAVLHVFNSESDGGSPMGRLVADTQGNLYGTTSKGGPEGEGTVFKLAASGEFTVLHSFSAQGSEGYDPLAGLIRDSVGNLYGSTSEGGTKCEGFSCAGSIFKLDPSGKLTILAAFNGGIGDSPAAELIQDSAGNLYGTTQYGFLAGVVFKISPQ